MENNDYQRQESSSRSSYSCYSNSPSTLATSARIGGIRRRRPYPGSIRTIHDNTSPSYGWLLPGWLAEERIMESGRTYRYFYDPSGNLYRTQGEVILEWEDLGLVVLDKK